MSAPATGVFYICCGPILIQADPRHRNSTNEAGLGRQAETRSRTVCIRNLPPATQEGLLQQALEKHALVRRVEVFQDLNEAAVELENAAVSSSLLANAFLLLTILQEAGKLLLRTEPIVFNGTPLQISEDVPGGRSRPRPSAPPTKMRGLFVPRAAVSRPRAGLGQPRKPGVGAGANGTTPAASSTGSTLSQQGHGQDDFRKMLAGGK